jgi:hypothetical protein
MDRWVWHQGEKQRMEAQAMRSASRLVVASAVWAIGLVQLASRHNNQPRS